MDEAEAARILEEDRKRKERQKVYNKRYYQKNRDRLLAEQRARQQRIKEERAKAEETWYEAGHLRTCTHTWCAEGCRCVTCLERKYGPPPKY